MSRSQKSEVRGQTRLGGCGEALVAYCCLVGVVVLAPITLVLETAWNFARALLPRTYERRRQLRCLAEERGAHD